MGPGMVGHQPAGRSQRGQGRVDPEGQGTPAQSQRRLILPQAPTEAPRQDGTSKQGGFVRRRLFHGGLKNIPTVPG